MIEKTGTVESVDGDYAIIQAEDVEVYHHFVLSLYRVQTRFEEDEMIKFYALNIVGAKPGDRVRFTLPVKKFFDATYLEYVFLVLLAFIAFVFGFPVVVIGAVIMILYKLKPKNDDTRETAEKKDVPCIVEILS